MTGNAAREGELPEKLAQTILVGTDGRIDFAIGALEPCVGDDTWCAMTRPGDEERIEAARLDDTIEVHIEEVKPGGRTPVSKQPRLDVIHLERFAEQRIIEQINLSNREVIGGAPPSVDQADLIAGEWLACRLGLRVHGHSS